MNTGWSFDRDSRTWFFGDSDNGIGIQWVGMWEGKVIVGGEKVFQGNFYEIEDAKEVCIKEFLKVKERLKNNKFKRVCTCGKQFYTNKPNKKFCSPECYKSWLKTRVKPIPKLKTKEPFPEQYPNTDTIEKRSEWDGEKWVGF